MPALLGTAPTPALGRLDIAVDGLRSAAGLVQLCVTRDPAHFPDCTGDAAARHLTVPAARAAHLSIDGLAPGTYALALFHDENGNGRLDTRMHMPIEGMGFSNNPRILLGPPRFARAAFRIAPPVAAQEVRVRYLF